MTFYIYAIILFKYIYSYNLKLQKQYLDNSLRFVLDDFKTAKTLHNISYNITLRDDRKVINN